MDSISTSIEQLKSHLKQLDNSLELIKEKALSNESITLPPRIYLAGLFEGFDAASQTLEIRIGSEHQYYPISYYDGEWLPMPGQQVIITRTTRGIPLRGHNSKHNRDSANAAPRIIGFGERGMAIPAAPIRSFRVVGYNYEQGVLQLKGHGDERIQLSLPKNFAEYYDPNLRYGDILHYRVIDVMPGQYFIPLSLTDHQDKAGGTLQKIFKMLEV